jgi:hypothetical protein
VPGDDPGFLVGAGGLEVLVPLQELLLSAMSQVFPPVDVL